MYITRDDRQFYMIEDVVVSLNGKQYEVMERLGAGGNAAVYSCLNSDGTELAIKFLLNVYDKSLKRFKQEAKTLRMIQHPNLIQYVDEGITVAKQLKNGEQIEQNILFVVMEKADCNLREYLKKRGKIKYSEYAPQFIGLSEALEALHEKVIHRDLKLENILVIGERWIISDLGLCCYINEEDREEITTLHEKIGPKYWMSPEAINKIYNEEEQIIPASDVFQLVAIFWFAVTNRYPLGNVSIEDWGDNDRGMCRVLLKGLQHDNLRRQQNGYELHQEIIEIIREHGGI